MTRHEAIIQALVAALAGHPSTVTREAELPQVCPPGGIVNLVPRDPEEVARRLGVVAREINRVVDLECVVQSGDPAVRSALLDASLSAIGVLLSNTNLGGLVDYLDVGEPASADDVPMEGAASLKGATVPVTLYYETSNNPMETYP